MQIITANDKASHNLSLIREYFHEKLDSFQKLSRPVQDSFFTVTPEFISGQYYINISNTDISCLFDMDFYDGNSFAQRDSKFRDLEKSLKHKAFSGIDLYYGLMKQSRQNIFSYNERSGEFLFGSVPLELVRVTPATYQKNHYSPLAARADVFKAHISIDSLKDVKKALACLHPDNYIFKPIQRTSLLIVTGNNAQYYATDFKAMIRLDIPLNDVSGYGTSEPLVIQFPTDLIQTVAKISKSVDLVTMQLNIKPGQGIQTGERLVFNIGSVYFQAGDVDYVNDNAVTTTFYPQAEEEQQDTRNQFPCHTSLELFSQITDVKEHYVQFQGAKKDLWSVSSSHVRENKGLTYYTYDAKTNTVSTAPADSVSLHSDGTPLNVTVTQKLPYKLIVLLDQAKYIAPFLRMLPKTSQGVTVSLTHNGLCGFVSNYGFSLAVMPQRI